MQSVKQPQSIANSVEDDSPPQLKPGVSKDSRSSPQQNQLSRADPDIRAAQIHLNLPGCPKTAFLDINWHPPSRSGAFKLRTKVSLADDTLEHAEQPIFLFISPDKVHGLSLHSIPEPVSGGHTHILRFDFKSPPTFVSPTKNLDSADPDSGKAIRLFSDLVKFSTLELPLDLATVSSLPATPTALTTNTTLATLEEMCKAFQDGNGMAPILSCLNVSSLYNGRGGVSTTPAQFPDANPPDYTPSRKRSTSNSTASRPTQRPRLGSQAGLPQPDAEQHQLGLDPFEEMNRRFDTAAQQMEASCASADARMQSMIEARSDVMSRRQRSLTNEIDTQRDRFDTLLARSGSQQVRSDTQFQAMMGHFEHQRSSLVARLQAMRNVPSDSQRRRLDALTWRLDIQRERSATRLRSLTVQLEPTRAHTEAQAVDLHASGEELRSHLSRQIDSLTGQIHTQNAGQTRLIISLGGRVETLPSNQARRIEDLE